MFSIALRSKTCEVGLTFVYPCHSNRELLTYRQSKKLNFAVPQEFISDDEKSEIRAWDSNLQNFSSEYYNFVLVFFVENFSLESIVLKYNDVNIYCAVLQNGKYEKITILSKSYTFLSC